MDKKKKNSIIGVSIAIVVLLAIIAIVVPIACVKSQKDTVKSDITITTDQSQNKDNGQANNPTTEIAPDKTDNNDTTNNDKVDENNTEEKVSEDNETKTDETENTQPDEIADDKEETESELEKIEGYNFNNIDLSSPQTFNATDLNIIKINDISSDDLYQAYYCLFVETSAFEKLKYSLELAPEIEKRAKNFNAMFIKDNVTYENLKTYLTNFAHDDGDTYQDQMGDYFELPKIENCTIETNTNGCSYAMLCFLLDGYAVEEFESHSCKITISKVVS